MVYQISGFCSANCVTAANPDYEYPDDKMNIEEKTQGINEQIKTAILKIQMNRWT